MAPRGYSYTDCAAPPAHSRRLARLVPPQGSSNTAAGGTLFSNDPDDQAGIEALVMKPQLYNPVRSVRESFAKPYIRKLTRPGVKTGSGFFLS